MISISPGPSTTVNTDATGMATWAVILNQSPGAVSVSASFAETATQLGATAGPQAKTVTGDPSIGPGPFATSLYTGPSFFWTTSPTSSTATLTLNATVKDTGVCPGDIRTAKVSFYVSQNSGTSFSPISNAQNLPVGLVNVSDTTTGTASTTSQYNLGSDKFASLVIRVVVGGNYVYNEADYDVPVVVAVPGQPNTLTAAGKLGNDQYSLASVLGAKYFASGYLGAGNGTTDGISSGAKFDDAVEFGGFVQCNNSKCTNPQGQINLKITTYNKPDGTFDSTLHRYFVKSNAISGWGTNITNAGFFSAKTNVYETTGDTRAGIDGGGMMQMVFAKPGGQYTYTSTTGNKKVTLTCPTSATTGCASIIVYRSNGLGGGVWYSSAWGPVAAGDLPQTIMKAMLPGGMISFSTGAVLGAPVLGEPTSSGNPQLDGTSAAPTTAAPTASTNAADAGSSFVGAFVRGTDASAPRAAADGMPLNTALLSERRLFVGQAESKNRGDDSDFAADGTLGKNWIGSRFDNSVESITSGTTTDGRVTVTVRSCNKRDGTVDKRCVAGKPSTHHVYVFETDMISNTTFVADIATLDSKAVVYELLANGEKRILEKDVAMQIVFVPENQMIPLIMGAPGGSSCTEKLGCAAIAARKADGSLWYSGGWRFSLAR
jgi:hypothetical protein